MSINKMLDQIDKLWDMHAIECYKSMKKNEVALYKLIQKNLQAIQLNGINNVQNSEKKPASIPKSVKLTLSCNLS